MTNEIIGAIVIFDCAGNGHTGDLSGEKIKIR